MILPDLLERNLKLVICGTAAGNTSAERKAYYAGKGNLFYRILAKCGYTSFQLKPQQFPDLLKYGIGLTDLAKYTHGMDNDLRADDYDAKSFEEKILKYQPQIICFNGKEAARIYLKLKSTKSVVLGLQHIAIGSTKLYVAPSTSLQARRYWDETYWQQLQMIIKM